MIPLHKDNGMTEVCEAALHYARDLRAPVIPVNAEKKPIISKWGGAIRDRWVAHGQSEDEIRALFDKRYVYGVAVLTCPYSPHVVLDFDGPHAQEAWRKLTTIELPMTSVNTTPSGSFHAIYTVNEQDTLNITTLIQQQNVKRGIRLVKADCVCPKTCGVDFLVNGYYIVPPTPGYAEKPDLPPFGSFTPLPAEVLRLAMEKSSRAAPATTTPREGSDWAALLHGPVPEGERHGKGVQLVGHLKGKGVPAEEIRAIMRLWARHACVPPLDAKHWCSVEDAIDRYAGTEDGRPVVSLGIDAFLVPPPVLEMDIEGVRIAGDHGWTSGAPKSMKGYWSLEEARAVATGSPFLGHFKTQKKRVLYISEEDRKERLWRRVYTMMIERLPEEIPGADDLRFLVKQGVRLNDPHGQRVLREQLDAFRPDVVFLEHFDRMHDKNINRAEEVRPLLNFLDGLHTEFGCTFRIQKHHRKEAMGQSKRTGEMIAGSVALFGWGESSVYLTLLKRGLAKVEVEAKDGETSGVFLVRYEAGRVVYAGEPASSKVEGKQQEALAYVETHPGATTEEIAKAIGRVPKTTTNYLKALEKTDAVSGNQETSKHPTRWWPKSTEANGDMGGN